MLAPNTSTLIRINSFTAGSNGSQIVQTVGSDFSQIPVNICGYVDILSRLLPRVQIQLLSEKNFHASTTMHWMAQAKANSFPLSTLGITPRVRWGKVLSTQVMEEMRWQCFIKLSKALHVVVSLHTLCYLWTDCSCYNLDKHSSVYRLLQNVYNQSKIPSKRQVYVQY